MVRNEPSVFICFLVLLYSPPDLTAIRSAVSYSFVHFYSIVEMEEPMLSPPGWRGRTGIVIKHRPSPLRGEGKTPPERRSVGRGRGSASGLNLKNGIFAAISKAGRLNVKCNFFRTKQIAGPQSGSLWLFTLKERNYAYSAKSHLYTSRQRPVV
jgi:hypothetical protein